MTTKFSVIKNPLYANAKNSRTGSVALFDHYATRQYSESKREKKRRRNKSSFLKLSYFLRLSIISSILIAASEITVPGPKMAATPC